MRTINGMTGVERRWARVRGVASGHAARRGSTLIVVIGMLGLLLLIGLTYFSFAAQEDQAAQYFTEGAKVTPSDTDPFLFGIEQILMGARAPHYNSALYTGPASGATGLGRHSLIGLMLGGDGAPYSGAGQNIVYRDEAIVGNSLTPDGLPDAGAGAAFPWGRDDNFDGIPDGEPFINLSIASRGGRVPRIPGTPASGITLPAPDVNYTYPDANNLFLAYFGTVWDDVSGRFRRFVIPSFHRPQYMRDLTTGAPATNWASSATFATRVLRVHPEHVTTSDPFNGGPVTATTNRRFLTVAGAVNALGLPVNEFPFASMIPDQGVFDADVRGLDPGLSADRTTIASRLDAQERNVVNTKLSGVNYDVDNDNDGIREGVWLDLDYPVQRLADGRLYTVLFSFTIVDADGLINMNEAGNLAGAHVDGSGNPTNPTAIRKASVLSTTPVSRSNLGMSPSELNPGYALNADSTSLADFPNAATSDRGTLPMRTLYNVPNRTAVTHSAALTPVELGNLELLSLLTGRVKFRTQAGGGLTLDGTDFIFDGSSLDEAVVTGRWGEASSLIQAIWSLPGSAVRLNAASDWLTGSPSASFLFPRPGRSTTDFNPFSVAAIQGDDNGNRLREIVYSTGIGFLRQTDPYLPNILLPVPKQPVDFRGIGTFVTTASAPNGPKATVAVGPASGTPNRWPSFAGYGQLRDDTNSAAANPWEAAGLSTSVLAGSASDEPGETVSEPKFARTTTGDQVFGVNEVAGLHLKGADDTTAGGTNYRLRELAPANFGDPASTTGDRGSLRTNATELNTGDSVNWPRGIRDRFTTSSWDRPQPGLARHAERPWEITMNPITGRAEFPPWYGAGFVSEFQQPFRSELRSLLRATYDQLSNDSSPSQLRLNINRFLDSYWDSGRNRSVLHYRRLMPHPAQLGSTPVPTMEDVRTGTRTMGGDMNLPGIARMDDNGNGTPSAPNTSDPNEANDWGELGAAGSDDIMPWSDPTAIGNANFPVGGQLQDSRNAIQEFWARRDRQMMARDIYVMLYTLGGSLNKSDFPDFAAGRPGSVWGSLLSPANWDPMFTPSPYDLWNPAPTADLGYLNSNPKLTPIGGPPTDYARPLFTDAQLREMAQFAVNYVDALDTDDVMTLFEYDRDLSNGWAMDDDPSTATAGELDRAVVVGVEMPTLMFNEASIVQLGDTGDPVMDDKDATYFGDGDGDQVFAGIEIANVSPMNVDFGTQAVATTNQWRVRRLDGAGNTLAQVRFRGDQMPELQAGGIMVLGDRNGSLTQGGTARPSYMRVNVTSPATGLTDVLPVVGDPTMEVVMPARLAGTYDSLFSAGTWSEPGVPAMVAGTTEPFVYVDLRWSYTIPPVLITGSQAISPANLVAGTEYVYVLERKANPANPLDEESPGTSNPWVVVDEIRYTPDNQNFLNLSGVNKADTVTVGTMRQQKSGERQQPLDNRLENYQETGPLAFLGNTLGNTNGFTGRAPTLGEYTFVPRSFDREFTSAIEWMSLPLFGPGELSRKSRFISDKAQVNPDPASGNGMTTSTGFDAAGTEVVAAHKFLKSDYRHPTNNALNVDLDTTNAPVNPQHRWDNAWYRLFEFVEVPSDRNAQVQQYLKSPRTPGKINLNTVRDAAVLAGLVDDRLMISGYDPLLNSTNYEVNSRYWWLQFVKARDQRDPVTGLYLPGTAASRPFLGFNALPNHVARPQSGIERTLLRTLAANLTNQETYPDSDVGYTSDYRRSGYFDIDMDEAAMIPIDFADERADRRQLFEARTKGDLASQSGANTVDPHTRHRLLHKVVNNSTTRSHVFMVWVSVTRCEVVFDAATRTYRIGGRLDGESDLASSAGDYPIQRAFFVLDRSQLEEAYDARTGTFNFRKFIKYRKTLQE